ncbi:MAG: hypothetical protein L6408_02575, partial [Nanoarchaeota archaeon]|nr:hypothetical protein [Nanoarchaeota archaeon]
MSDMINNDEGSLDNRILELFKIEQRPLRSGFVAPKVGVSKKTVVNHFKYLKKELGLLKERSIKGTNHWELTQRGKEHLKIAMPRIRKYTGLYSPYPFSSKEINLFKNALKESYQKRFSFAEIIIDTKEESHRRFKKHPCDNKPRFFTSYKYDTDNKILLISPFAMTGESPTEGWGTGIVFPTLPQSMVVYKPGGSYDVAYGKEIYSYAILLEIYLPSFGIHSSVIEGLGEQRVEGFFLNSLQGILFHFIQNILQKIAEKEDVYFRGGYFSIRLHPKGTQKNLKGVTKHDISI